MYVNYNIGLGIGCLFHGLDIELDFYRFGVKYHDLIKTSN